MATEVLEASRKLAESLSSTLSDAERDAYGKSAAWVAEGLRKFADESQSPAEVAVRLSHVLVRMLAEAQQMPLMEASDFCQQNMIAYALAAGNVAGVYDLPSEDGSPEPQMSEPLRIVPRDPQIGQYL